MPKYLKLFEDWEAPEDLNSPDQDDLISSGVHKQSNWNTWIFEFQHGLEPNKIQVKAHNLLSTQGFVHEFYPVTRVWTQEDRLAPLGSHYVKQLLPRAKSLGCRFVVNQPNTLCWKITGERVPWTPKDRELVKEEWDAPEDWGEPNPRDLSTTGLQHKPTQENTFTMTLYTRPPKVWIQLLPLTGDWEKQVRIILPVENLSDITKPSIQDPALEKALTLAKGQGARFIVDEEANAKAWTITGDPVKLPPEVEKWIHP